MPRIRGLGMGYFGGKRLLLDVMVVIVVRTLTHRHTHTPPPPPLS